MSNKDWDLNLTPEQNYILRQEGTESPGTSSLNNEKREGAYHCIGCGTKLFESKTKYDSGTGWPSFCAPITVNVNYRNDWYFVKLLTEAHCNRCGGHLGHVFDDGPKPTGKRYCNNGKVLTFKEEK